MSAYRPPEIFRNFFGFSVTDRVLQTPYVYRGDEMTLERLLKMFLMALERLAVEEPEDWE
jgi:hypothetical protein